MSFSVIQPEGLGGVGLAGGASTQSRARRPLPTGAKRAVTLHSDGVNEMVRYEMDDGRTDERWMLSWVVGQHGCLWGSLAEMLLYAETPGSYGHELEHAVTERLARVYGPLWQRPLAVRYFANGSDACAAAARVARAVTGRDLIASCGYHGAHLDFAHRPASVGVPASVLALHPTFEWGDLRTMRKLARVAAAVVVEVPPVEDDEARSFLVAVREACTEGGALMVIDDVVLGFRIALGGSLERYGVLPDMVTLGKALSRLGGVAALLGREEEVGLLSDVVFYSTTFGGHPLLMQEAMNTLDKLIDDSKNTYRHLGELGQSLKSGLEDLGYTCAGQAERFVVTFSTEEVRRRWCTMMMDRGVIVDRPFYATLAHTPAQVEFTLAQAAEVIREMKAQGTL